MGKRSALLKGDVAKLCFHLPMIFTDSYLCIRIHIFILNTCFSLSILAVILLGFDDPQTFIQNVINLFSSALWALL